MSPKSLFIFLLLFFSTSSVVNSAEILKNSKGSYVIKKPGYYVLKKDIKFKAKRKGQSAITIAKNVSHVVLDLNGNTVKSTHTSKHANVNGIHLHGNNKRIEILNGSIEGFSGQAILVEGNSALLCFKKLNLIGSPLTTLLPTSTNPLFPVSGLFLNGQEQALIDTVNVEDVVISDIHNINVTDVLVRGVEAQYVNNLTCTNVRIQNLIQNASTTDSSFRAVSALRLDNCDTAVLTNCSTNSNQALFTDTNGPTGDCQGIAIYDTLNVWVRGCNSSNNIGTHRSQAFIAASFSKNIEYNDCVAEYDRLVNPDVGQSRYGFELTTPSTDLTSAPTKVVYRNCSAINVQFGWGGNGGVGDAPIKDVILQNCTAIGFDNGTDAPDIGTIGFFYFRPIDCVFDHCVAHNFQCILDNPGAGFFFSGGYNNKIIDCQSDQNDIGMGFGDYFFLDDSVEYATGYAVDSNNIQNSTLNSIFFITNHTAFQNVFVRNTAISASGVVNYLFSGGSGFALPSNFTVVQTNQSSPFPNTQSSLVNFDISY